MRKDPPDASATLPSGGTLTGHPDAVRAVVVSIEAARERRKRWPVDERGELDTARAMTALARAFPSLAHADGVEPWNAHRFVEWLAGPAPSSGAAHAGRFVLSVWNPSADWREVARANGIERAADDERLAHFDLVSAIAVWDDAHRAACWRWMEAPFWP